MYYSELPGETLLIPYEISVATPEDALGICEVRKIAWLNSYEHEDPDPLRVITIADLQSKDYDSEIIVNYYKRQALNTEEQQILVAKDADKVIGTIIGRRKEGFNTFVTFFVLPEYQGKGIGTQLLDRTLSWFGNNNPVKITVVDYNTDSIEKYKHWGFHITSEPELHDTGITPSGKHIYEIEMTKDT